jgi:hypothetical protein
MANLKIEDLDAIKAFAIKSGCTTGQVKYAIEARGHSELAILSYLSLRGFVTRDVFLKRRAEIT